MVEELKQVYRFNSEWNECKGECGACNLPAYVISYVGIITKSDERV